MSLVKLLDAVDGIISIKTHLKGTFGLSEILDLAFFSLKKFDMMYKKGLDIFLALSLPKHYQYHQLTMIWWIYDIISDVIILKQFSSLLVISFSLISPWFTLEMHVLFVHYVEKLLHYSPLLRSIRCQTLCEKDKYVLNSLT